VSDTAGLTIAATEYPNMDFRRDAVPNEFAVIASALAKLAEKNKRVIQSARRLIVSGATLCTMS
jgi:hypothetical protein